MKVLLLSLSVLCIVACNVQAQCFGGFPGRSTGPTVPRRPIPFPRLYRRETPEESEGSITVEGRQSLNGEDGEPSLDVNYNYDIINDDRTKRDAFGVANLHDGRVTPQAGFGLEHTFNNDIFIHGRGPLQPGPHGSLSPRFGAGMRFRREALPSEEEEYMEEPY